MTKEQIADVVARLDAIEASDAEAAHGDADEILLEAVPQKIREAYERVVTRAPWWAYA